MYDHKAGAWGGFVSEGSATFRNVNLSTAG